jgi:hypothetical protein
MKFITTITILSLGFCSAAFAERFKLPEDSPVATINIPEAWGPRTYDNGVEAASDDGSVYLAVEAVDVTSDAIGNSIEECIKYLKKKGVKCDESTQKKTESTLNGLPFYDLSWQGTDEDGPCKVSVSIAVVSEKKCLVFLYWASPKGEEKNKEALSLISDSIMASR